MVEKTQPMSHTDKSEEAIVEGQRGQMNTAKTALTENGKWSKLIQGENTVVTV